MQSFLSKPYCACPEIKLVSRLLGSQRPEVPANIHQIKNQHTNVFLICCFYSKPWAAQDISWGVLWTHLGYIYTPPMTTSPLPTQVQTAATQMNYSVKKSNSCPVFWQVPYLFIQILWACSSDMTKFFLSVLYICERIVSKARPSPNISNT